MGVRVASTTPYNPRSDGQAEHTNRVVEYMLRSFVDVNPGDWDLFATNVEFAVNDSRSDVTGFTPFELCYGVSPMSQLDLFLEAAVQPGSAQRTGGGQEQPSRWLLVFRRSCGTHGAGWSWRSRGSEPNSTSGMYIGSTRWVTWCGLRHGT